MKKLIHLPKKYLIFLFVILLIGFALASVTVNFISQTPFNINTTNLYTTGLNITYNITSTTSTINASNVTLYYKTNSSTSSIQFFSNGTAYSGYFKKTGTNQSNNWTFSLSDDDIFPGTWNLNESVFANTAHSSTTLYRGASIKISFLNVTNSTSYNIFQFMANSTTTSNPAQIFYCNSSYVSGVFLTSPNCVQFATISPTQTYNITEPQLNLSEYQYAGMYINTTTGKSEDLVKVTPTSYFILRNPTGGLSKSQWNFYYIPTISRTDAVQTTSNDGSSWISQSYTADSHFQQFNGNYFYSYVCASDVSGNSSCSTIRSESISLNDIPPSSPYITNPSNQTYSGVLNITYDASISPVGNAITGYNITLLYSNESFYKIINGNNYPYTNYLWGTTSVPDGQYIIKVTAIDNESFSSYGLSPVFTIKNIVPPSGGGGTFTQYPVVTVTPTNITYPLGCGLNIETNAPAFGNAFLNFAIPWWDWKGITVNIFSCNDIYKWKWLFSYKEEGGTYTVIGIRLYILLLFILALILIGWIMRETLWK